VDREVERAEMDRDPVAQVPLLLGVELAFCERIRRERQREPGDDDGHALHAAGLPKYVASESTSSNVYASAYTTAAPRARCGSLAAAATSTASTATVLKTSSKASIPDEARLVIWVLTRASSSEAARTPAQRTAPSAHAEMSHPATRNTARATPRTSSAPAVGSSLPGTGLGVVMMDVLTLEGTSIAPVDGEHAGRDAGDRSPEQPVLDRAGSPPDQGPDADAERRRRSK